ncbi:hypothetical protein PXNS11_140035 [Stutzerimonas xanthomarina]|nr:hypothetical protein PXNS11_140035 [Stutzerimonas xanthomarina]
MKGSQHYLSLSEADGDAWKRRIARDWEKLPLTMRMFFLASFSAWRWLPLFGYALLAMVPLMLLGAIHDSYLVGGSGLINEQYLRLAGCSLILVTVFAAMLPRAMTLGVESWYRARRNELGRAPTQDRA